MLIFTSVDETHSTAHTTPPHTQPPVPISTQVVQGALEPLGRPAGLAGRFFDTIFHVRLHLFLSLASTPLARALHCARVDSSGMYRSTTNCATNCKRLLPVSELWTHHLPIPFTTLPEYQLSMFDLHAAPTLDQPIASRLLKASGVMMDGS